MKDGLFDKGDLVSYGTNGICCIEDIRFMSFSSGAKKSMYYILKPEASGESTIFVPAENEKLVSKMRKLMTKEEIDEMISSTRDRSIEWESDRRFRNENFHEILTAGVRPEMLLMIRCIYNKKEELTENGKKLSESDNATLKTAEKLVEEEFSRVLEIKNEDVETYIKRMLNMEVKPVDKAV